MVPGLDGCFIFKGMVVLDPVSFGITRVVAMNDFGGLKLENDITERYHAKSTVYPVMITSVKIGFFGFGKFKTDEDNNVLYHEPIPDDPENNFYGEYNLKEKYLSLSGKNGNMELTEIQYVHELQAALMLFGYKRLALTSEISHAGKTIYL